MKKHLGKVLCVVVAVPSVALAGAAGKAGIKVVYGEDNRKEVFEAKPEYQKLAKSTAIMVSKETLVMTPATDAKSSAIFQLPNKTYGDFLSYNPYSPEVKMPICENVPYTAQYNPGFCSGFLVGPDLLVTAGHCIKSQFDCASYNWVFDLNVDETTKQVDLKIPAERMYSCKKVIRTALDNSKGLDFAIIQLDRVVEGREPLKYRAAGKITADEGVLVIGGPTGLPTKVADGAKVRRSFEPGYFVANLDTFQGNSGSAVFNEKTLEIEGILVRGENDHDWNYEKECVDVVYCKDTECRGEDVSRISTVTELALREKMIELARTGTPVELGATILVNKIWIDLYDNSRVSMLSHAVEAKMYANVTKLIELKADVNLVDLKGQTALHRLVMNETTEDSLKLVDLFVAAKADLNLKNKDGLTALQIAATTGKTEMALKLMSVGADKTGIVLIAMKAGQVDTALKLAAAGAYVDASDEAGVSALELALDSEDMSVVAAFLEVGANPNTYLSTNEFPLVNAVLENNEELVALFLGAGADPRLASQSGFNAISAKPSIRFLDFKEKAERRRIRKMIKKAVKAFEQVEVAAE